jgi:hypothetical protein
MQAEQEKSAVMKITEPKTPYIRYAEEDRGSSSDVSLVELGESMDSDSDVQFEFEWTSDEEQKEEGEKVNNQTDHFLDKRSKHYEMKEALALGKNLLSKDQSSQDAE